MTEARRMIESATFDPEALKILGQVFDAVWAEIAAEFEEQEVAGARVRLAIIVLDLARDGQLGPHQIAQTAQRLIRASARANH